MGKRRDFDLKEATEEIQTDQDKKYVFSVQDAEKYGVPEAVMLQNLRYWVKLNKEKQSPMHRHEGRYWTFNSANEFTKTFTFWTPRQIERILKKLVSERVLLKGKFNRRRYDQTCWYTLNDDSSLVENERERIPPNGEKDSPEKINQNSDLVEPIPNVNYKSKPDIIVSTSRLESEQRSFSFQEKPKEQEETPYESLALPLGSSEFESLVQLKWLDDYDQAFLAEIVDRPLAEMTKKQVAKLEKIRKKGASGRKIEQIRQKDPDEIEFENRQALLLKERLMLIDVLPEPKLVELARSYYGLKPEVDEIFSHFRKRVSVAAELNKDWL